MLQLRMVTHMHHIQNIKHLMYPKYPNEKYFNKVQVQYLSTWVNALSRRPSVVLLMFSSPGSVTVTAGPVRTRGGSTSPAPLCILVQAARGKLERNFLDLLLLVLLHFLVQMFLFMERKTQSQLVTLVCDKSCFCFLCLGAWCAWCC